MKILWNENPMRSSVELNDDDKKLLKAKIMIEILTEFCYDIKFGSEDQASLERQERTIKAIKNFDVEQKEKRADEHYEYAIAALSSTHCGDCTCVAASCEKCWAEDLLGINTIEGLSQHAGRYILGGFSNDRSIDEVLDDLKNWEAGPREGAWMKYSQKDYDKLCKSWKSQSDSAYKWLLNYKETKLEMEKLDDSYDKG